MSDALHMAKDLLSGWLLMAEEDGEDLPKPSSPNQLTIQKGDLIIPIEADLNIAKLKNENTYVKKTLTIPKYLNELGKEENINFSQLLTDALKKTLLI